jgi:hypothetical protein
MRKNDRFMRKQNKIDTHRDVLIPYHKLQTLKELTKKAT